MNPTQDFLSQLRACDTFGIVPTETVVDGIPYLQGQFWTARQRQGHSIHEVSYRGCFKAELPSLFIDGLTAPGDVVYDPFAGRGTTLVQAALMGRIPIGNDINPLSAMLCLPRCAPPSQQEVVVRLAAIDWSGDLDIPEVEDLLAFYHPDTLRQIVALRRYLDRPLDAVDAWIRMVATNRLTGHSSGYFSGYTLPPNQAASAVAQRRINERRNLTPPVRDVPALIARKSASLLRDGGPTCAVRVLTGPAHATPGIENDFVDLVVTSPPFIDVIRYDQDNWLRCWFAGIDPKSVQLSQFKDVADWQAMVRATLTELARVVRPGGHVAFEVGEVRGGTIQLERPVWEAADGLFERVGVIVNGGAFTKTANIWKVSNNTKGTNTNRIVLLRK